MEDHAEADLAAVASEEALAEADLAAVDTEADFTVAFTEASDIVLTDITTVAADFLVR